MLNKVYLMCSLPALSFGQTPPISLEEFREMAKNELSAGNFKVLEQMTLLATESKEKKVRMKKVDDIVEGLLNDISEIRIAGKEKFPCLKQIRFTVRLRSCAGNGMSWTH